MNQYKEVVFLSLLISTCFSSAQVPFKKVISTYGPYNSIINSQNQYILSAANFALKLDDVANVLSIHGVGPSSTHYIVGNLTITNDQKYIFSADEYLSGLQHWGNLIYKTDTSGNLIWKKVYDTIPHSYEKNLYSASNGMIIASGYTLNSSNFPYHTAILKLDSSGNPIWRKYYNLEYQSYYFIGGQRNLTLESHTGDYVVGLSHSNNHSCGLLKMDTAGAIIWCKTYYNTGSALFTLLQNVDGSIMFLGSQIYNPLYAGTIFLTKVDSSGNFVWAKSYGDSLKGPFSLRATPDNGYIICCSIKAANRTGTDLLLIKTDSVGNMQWSRTHGNDVTYENGGVDAFPTSDGGYFAVGTFDGPSPSYGCYIIKTDSLGFVGCQEFTDSIVVNNIFTTDSLIQVTDTLVPVQIFNSAIYDSIAPFPSVYNGCFLSGLDKNNSLVTKLNAYPNPTLGKLNIKTNEPSKGGKIIIVYDSMGRVVLQKKYNIETDMQLDLTRYDKGIYLIKVIDGDKVSECKVIVE